VRRRAGARGQSSQKIDRDALLRAIFPNGVPPRQAVIEAANRWLDEAERLARAT
jgi:hypothetical protein